MTITSETKSHFERLLSEIYARRPLKNNKRMCEDCLKPRSISLSVKIVVALNFVCSNIKILHLKY